jgi:hypothetical protein
LTDVAHPRHELVRSRYGGRCGVSETDTAGELTVDHFVPVSAAGDDSDDNLVYSCSRCNLHKADFVPNASQLAQGLRLLHPLRDRTLDHITVDEQTGLLVPLTETGRLHIAVLHLNRLALVAHRLRQFVVAAMERNLQLAEKELTALQSEVVLLRQQVQALKALEQQGHGLMPG